MVVVTEWFECTNPVPLNWLCWRGPWPDSPVHACWEVVQLRMVVGYSENLSRGHKTQTSSLSTTHHINPSHRIDLKTGCAWWNSFETSLSVVWVPEISGSTLPYDRSSSRSGLSLSVLIFVSLITSGNSAWPINVLASNLHLMPIFAS